MTVPVGGDYGVIWVVEFLPFPSQQHAAFGVFVNGVLRNSTRAGAVAFTGQELTTVSGDAIVQLNAGDTLDLRALIPPVSTQTAIQLSATIQYPPFGGAADQPINSATLRVFRLGAAVL